MRQYKKDLPSPMPPPWRHIPVQVRAPWTPEVGDSIVGDLSWRDGWGAIGHSDTFQLRATPHVDVPVRAEGKPMVHALRELMPQLGDGLRVTRLADGTDRNGYVSQVFSVERVPDDDEPDDSEGFKDAA